MRNKIPSKPKNISSSKLKTKVIKILEDKKAENVVAIDLKGKTDLADYMVVASGNSSRHASSLADFLTDELKKDNILPLSVEGMTEASWIVVDLEDIIVHIFKYDIRELYNLEEMWEIPLGKIRAKQ